MRYVITLGLILMISQLPIISLAEEIEAQSTMETLVVTAGRVEEKKKEVSVNTIIIEEETIGLSSAQNLGDLLGEQGFYIRKYPGTNTSVGIRGFRTDTLGNDLTSHVLILLNGRRAGTGNVAKILTKNVERIEIIKGPASVQYGSSAVGGLINVITKQGYGKPGFFVEGGLGSWEAEEASIGFSGEYKKFDFSGSYTIGSQDSYNTASGEKYFNTGFDKKSNISLNLGLNLLPYHRFGVIYTGFDINNQGNPSYLSQNDLDDYSDMSNQSLDFIYNGESSNERFEWMGRYFNGEDKNRWVSPTASNPGPWFSDDGIPYEDNTDNQGVQAQISAKLNNWSITGGLDWVDYSIESSFTPQKSSYDNMAGFVLAKTSLLNDRLIANGGLRYDRYEVEVQEPPSNKEDDDHIAPSLGLAYSTTDWLKLRANYGQAFVMPGADQLAADYFSGVTVVGNPNLKPETSQTIEGGFDIYQGSFYGGLTYFYTDFEDKIERIYLTDGSQSWENLGSSVISGLEGELGFDIGAFYNWIYEVRPYTQFTYLTQYEDNETNEDLLYTPDWSASLGVTVIQQESGLSANLNFAYTGKQRIEDFENGWPAEVTTLGGFTVANLSMLKNLVSWERYGDLTLKAEILNLFNKDYAYVKGYPMPGRSFFVGLRYDY